MKKIKEKSKNSILFNTIATIVIVLHLLLVFLPCLWGIMQSFKSEYYYAFDKIGFSPNPDLTNYELVWNHLNWLVTPVGSPSRTVFVEEGILNTFLYAGGTSIVGFIVQYMVAYVLFRFKHFKSSPVFYTIIVIAINLPLAGGVASSLKLYRTLGLYDNMIAMWIMNAHPLNFYFLVLYSALYIIPNDLYEAAEMDGAGRIRIMVQIALPLVKGVVLLFFLEAFITAWNDYATCLMFMPSYPTIGYMLFQFNQKSNPPEIVYSGVKLAAAFLCALPVIIVFVIFGNKMMKGVSVSGGIKG